MDNNDDFEMYGEDTPWEMLLYTIDANQQHKEILEQLIKSHNNLVRRLNKAETDIQNLNRRIMEYEAGLVAKTGSQ